ncbi:hypothetical protein SeLEV6574_g06436 [Synchytrium endobioticum]|nr:hypothetical protein SeLEV6574_g06436 [Synchytrium endobioticum]
MNQTTVSVVNGGPVVTFNIGTNISLVNPGYYPVTVAIIDVTGAPIVRGQSSQTMKANGSLSSVYLPSQRNVSVILPITVTYNASSVAAALADPFWVDMLQACGLVPFSTPRPLTFQYNTLGWLQGLDWVKVTRTGTLNYTCQINATDITRALGGRLI